MRVGVGGIFVRHLLVDEPADLWKKKKKKNPDPYIHT